MAEAFERKPSEAGMNAMTHGLTGKGGGQQRRSTERAKDTQGTIRRLMVYFQPYRFILFSIFLFATVAAVLALVTPYLIGKAVDQIIKGSLSSLIILVFLYW